MSNTCAEIVAERECVVSESGVESNGEPEPATVTAQDHSAGDAWAKRHGRWLAILGVIALTVILGLTFDGRGEDSSSKAPGGTESSPAYVPPWEDPAASQQEVTDSLQAAFCSGGGSVTDMGAAGYVLLNCAAGDPTGSAVFYVFQDAQQMSLYLNNQPCQSGTYYEQGTIWFAFTLTPAPAALLENEAGTVPLTCG